MSEILRVLIIEDSALDAKVLVGLIQAGGYEVTLEEAAAQEGHVDRFKLFVDHVGLLAVGIVALVALLEG